MTQQAPHRYLGKARKLVDGVEKVTGRARYAGDVSLPGMLHGKLALSLFAHARITRIDTAAALKIPGVVAVLTADDLPTRNRQPSSRQTTTLAREVVRYRGEPVALVLATSLAAAEDGVAALQIDYEPLPAPVTAEAALDPAAPVIWPQGAPKADTDLTAAHAAVARGEEQSDHVASNIHEQKRFSRGDALAALATAEVVVAGTYRTAIVHQGYLEPHAVVADIEPIRKHITLYTSTQGQFGVRDEVARLLGLRTSQVTVVPMTVGGGFGAKYGILDPLAAAAALAVGRPVRIVLDRSEDFLTTTPSPASTITIKLGATREGVLTAIVAEMVIDNGVYPFTLGGIMSTLLGGYYRCPNVQIDVVEVLTHKPQAGAYRAPGAPQVTFALESSIDELARRLELDPLELRLRNAATTGDPMGNNDPWPSMGLRQVLEAAANHPLWRERTPGSGVGLAIGGWPCGMSPAAAVCRVDTDGIVRVHVGSVDISGVNSSFVLVAAEILGVPPEQVEIVAGDTRSGPFAGPSGGSQITYSVAGAVAAAAQEARRQLLEVAADMLEARIDDLDLRDGAIHVRGLPGRTLPIGEVARRAQEQQGGPGPIVGEGRTAPAENAPGFVAHIVQVTVDNETGRVQPLRYVAIQDVGFPLNPLMVEGQIHGGAVQGIGWGLHEALRYDENGELLTASLMDYTLPRAADVPSIETVLVTNPAPNGPFGARGVGEPPITAGAAALANAIRDATGARIYELPMRDEVVWRAMQKGVNKQ
ncbi:MAG TPA: xanthine dehydrogenase family protein molybdopterin-binding subunit [Chloroflexus aurantiacus]|jgi:CO/xanthine dehydrogenase Mo-binding subunit|uniref:Xanthine dehydrogenase n=1 Tax=Chloroflexus aurantiacus (strain ATCC 29366 / DSM 635 / J-10-fl) TaxID=324602 RepID=A9WGP0_CHLAA|nr:MULTISPECIES: xanthine dehydrogenase family protein molybdopterin-binding subunit [Chloroflexus]ABY36206.1 Xanthine dehydrogenase [Chloroflexus aurantiacus J-10-fl]RMG53012.1 MAG: xanthine dehydrogenase family protein molybdopterin-binding subunit [Chloroflexota bacterium]HBW66880.1 xanthine dehydrogenase family protein molybdopterin-binding subunit [Chloroflexus aurantiacus]